MKLFGHGLGWESVQDDILTFAKLLNFEPSHEQAHYLLRAQNGGMSRFGTLKPFEETFPIIATVMLWRALAFKQPSICVTEFLEHGESWVKVMSAWLRQSDRALGTNVQVAKNRRFLKTADGTHICHVVGPWTSLDGYTAGKQDILWLDFDEMPRSRIDRVIELGEDSITFLPHSHGSLVQYDHGRDTPDGINDNS